MLVYCSEVVGCWLVVDNKVVGVGMRVVAGRSRKVWGECRKVMGAGNLFAVNLWVWVFDFSSGCHQQTLWLLKHLPELHLFKQLQRIYFDQQLNFGSQCMS